MKHFLLIILLISPCMIYAQGTPDFEKLCAKGDKLYEKGSYAEALKLYKQCLPYCKNCNDEIRGNRVLYCINRLKKPEWQVPPSVKSPNTPKYMVLIEPMVNPGDTIKEYEEVAKMPVELRDTTIIYRTIEKTKTDTLFITDNSNLIHPYFFIKSWTVEKKTWRWVFNGVGVVIGIGGGVGFGIAANNNYENHINNIALTKTKHSQYYSNYKLYSGLMWGCIGVGVVALSSNLFCSPVKDKVTISPGIYADPQGNMGMSVKIKF